MKPFAKTMSRLMLVILFASLLLSCSVFTGASSTTASPTGGGSISFQRTGFTRGGDKRYPAAG